MTLSETLDPPIPTTSVVNEIGKQVERSHPAKCICSSMPVVLSVGSLHPTSIVVLLLLVGKETRNPSEVRISIIPHAAYVQPNFDARSSLNARWW